MSLELIRETGVSPQTSVVDVGGGASNLVDRLVEAGFSDLTVLDVSEVALNGARERLSEDRGVTWLNEDVLSWKPARAFGLWHDRAVFHFFVTESERKRYLDTLHAALRSGGHLIIATFAPDGPESCSGLPVERYSPEDLCALIGPGFTLESARAELHTTPAGTLQPFTWIAGRLRPPS
ncbi:MAG: class I SAM-dependent methyltransferase [Acidimicrobiales bacterium]